jgi:hypothetical protein
MSTLEAWRDLPSIAWETALDKVCFCTGCVEANFLCRYCPELHRETTVRTSSVWGGPDDRTLLEKTLVVTVREWHMPYCARLNDDDVWRVDLSPVPVDDRKFEPVYADRILDIDLRHWPDSQWVYLAYGEGGAGGQEALLYVGATGDVRTRMRRHSRTSEWWPRCSFVLLRRYPDRALALAAERGLIATEHPVFNIKDRS